MPIQIREADNSDIAGIVRVIHAVFDEYGFTWEEDGYHADLYDIEGHYTQRGHTFLVAESDGLVIGTAALERFATIDGPLGELKLIDGFIRVQGCDCALERLYVHPEARRCGAGFALLETIIDIAKREGRLAMELWTDKRFVDAHRLYGRFGAAANGDRICHDPDQSPEWGMMIDLTGVGR